MKKLLGILVLGLLLSGSVYADEKKYSLFGVEIGNNINNYNPKVDVLDGGKIIIDPPKPNKNFILYWASINKKTNEIIIIGAIHKKNYLIGDENIEREELVQKMLNIARLCRIENSVFVEIIAKGPQFKEFKNNFEEFKSSTSSSQMYIFDGEKIDYGKEGNIKFSVSVNCINRYGTLVKDEKTGMRAEISLADHVNLPKAIKDNKEFDKQQLDKSGLQ